MTVWHPYSERIRLSGKGKVSAKASDRQEVTAREILRRFTDRPGLILADEVGMGKTFVALAVAASVALSDPKRRPVVIMVPPSLKEKWPRDFALLEEECLIPDDARKLTVGSADSGVEFLKLLDDPVDRRKSIIFLTHGAMHRNLSAGFSDAWIKLAIIRKALHHRHNVDDLRNALFKWSGRVLRLEYVTRRYPDIWERLLLNPPEQWLEVMRRIGMDPEDDRRISTDDDPVPELIIRTLENFNTDEVFESLLRMPLRSSSNFDARIGDVQKALNVAIRNLWRACLGEINFKLPLLILDEAHHLKNEKTRLASLFQVDAASEDAEEITSRGPLGGVFERMLFLTATPFQLGQHELCSVLERFDGISWKSAGAPGLGRSDYQTQIAELRKQLDKSQETSLLFDTAWGQLRSADLVIDDERIEDPAVWWSKIMAGRTTSAQGARVRECYERTRFWMKSAEKTLSRWVIRHKKERHVERNGVFHPRRCKLPGRAIIDDDVHPKEAGIEVEGDALLPFLLAARATVSNPDSRPVFAEGLASSYEAFLHTRKQRQEALDIDDDPDESVTDSKQGEWYLNRMEELLPLNHPGSSAQHPKIAATARRVIKAWRSGEKVVVFCHYIATGRVLRQVISSMMRDEILSLGAQKLGCDKGKAEEELHLLGKRFFDDDSPARQACNVQVGALLQDYPILDSQREVLIEVSRRFIRTPSFLARFFPLHEGHLDEHDIREAFSRQVEGGLSIQAVLNGFFKFLSGGCGKVERQKYIDAIKSLQTGSIRGKDAEESFSPDEIYDADRDRLLLPNVRLINGTTKSETRQKLMLTFNSPFFPEVLIASSVMAEGVDLHRFCRYVLHHDLCWNPSTLEQRTGRVDRLGAKVDHCGEAIRIYLPYLAATQDEKQYRVVMDRERWFNVVMGEQFKTSARTTDQLAERIPLPQSVADELAFQLEVEGVG